MSVPASSLDIPPIPRWTASERGAIAIVFMLVLAAVGVRPLVRRVDPGLAAQARALQDGRQRTSRSWLVPRVLPALISWEMREWPADLPPDDPWGTPYRTAPGFYAMTLSTPGASAPPATSRSKPAADCASAGPDRTWGTGDDLAFDLEPFPCFDREALRCARPALLALATGVALLALLARVLPRTTTTRQEVGLSVALAAPAIGLLVPFTTGWVDALPRETRAALSERLLVDARHAIVGSAVLLTLVGTLLLRLGRRAVELAPVEDDPTGPAPTATEPAPSGPP